MRVAIHTFLYATVQPPSTVSTAPVTKAASSEARYSAAWATSSRRAKIPGQRLELRQARADVLAGLGALAHGRGDQARANDVGADSRGA